MCSSDLSSPNPVVSKKREREETDPEPTLAAERRAGFIERSILAASKMGSPPETVDQSSSKVEEAPTMIPCVGHWCEAKVPADGDRACEECKRNPSEVPMGKCAGVPAAGIQGCGKYTTEGPTSMGMWAPDAYCCPDCCPTCDEVLCYSHDAENQDMATEPCCDIEGCPNRSYRM